MSKLTILLLAVSLSLVACGEDSAIKEVVKKQLKDPDSAKFGTTQVNKAGNLACISWNAKNSYGGMAGWTTADVKKSESGWEVLDIDASKEECSVDYLAGREQYLSSQSDGNAASKKAEAEAFSMLEKSRKLTKSETSKLVDVFPKGECYEIVTAYGYAAKAISTDFIRIEAEKLTKAGVKLPDSPEGKAMANPPSNRYKKQMADIKATLESGSCAYQRTY